ncbi:MAG: UbiX family flavin prenyltransferase [Chloroflexota bacterium]|nr:UbiX family flavin prenyltransferase [Chloroflexota bacterium]MDE2686562.1 UbiX family flavin prenyltransferase [Chloroflexota bacterium]
MTNQIAPNHPVVIGISGASGSMIANGLIDAVLQSGIPVIATASNAARIVWRQEMDTSFGEAIEHWRGSGDFTYCAPGDIQSPIASGSFPTRGMVIAPCSMSTVAALAHGFADNLIRRAADVCLKERRPLTIVPRETPLSAIHLENMAALSRLGVTVLPPEPPFYLKPKSLDDVANYVVQKALVSIGLIAALPQSMQYDGPARPPG